MLLTGKNNCALNNSANYILLLDIVLDNFWTQLVNSPAREENILDLVLASTPDIVDNLTVAEPFSDHNTITFSIPCWPYERRKTNKVIYSYSTRGPVLGTVKSHNRTERDSPSHAFGIS